MCRLRWWQSSGCWFQVLFVVKCVQLWMMIPNAIFAEGLKRAAGVHWSILPCFPGPLRQKTQVKAFNLEGSCRPCLVKLGMLYLCGFAASRWFWGCFSCVWSVVFGLELSWHLFHAQQSGRCCAAALSDRLVTSMHRLGPSRNNSTRGSAGEEPHFRGT